MKTSIKLALAATVLALGLCTSALSAQSDTPPPPPPDGGPGNCGKNPQEGFLVMLADELSLTQDQITKVKAILDDEKSAMDALRSSTSSTSDQSTIHTKVDAIIKSHRAQIRTLLTTDQQKIFDQMKPAGGHRGPPPPSDSSSQSQN